MVSAGEEVDEQVERVFREEAEVSSVWREVWELEASELDPEKNEGVTFLWRRVKFMEGNPRSVLGFWAGVEGVELKWIMAGRVGEWEAASSTLLDPYISSHQVSWDDDSPETTEATPPAFHQPVIPTHLGAAQKTLKHPKIKYYK